MKVGQNCSVDISARCPCNWTGVTLVAGGLYRFSADGCWTDWYIKHGPAGDPSSSFYLRLFEKFRRIPDRPWFELIGAIDCDLSSAFPIGKGTQYTGLRDGQLTCFANDVKGFYFNNRGKITVCIARIA